MKFLHKTMIFGILNFLNAKFVCCLTVYLFLIVIAFKSFLNRFGGSWKVSPHEERLWRLPKSKTFDSRIKSERIQATAATTL